MLFDRNWPVLIFIGVLFAHAAVADSWIPLSKPDERHKTFVDEQSLERTGNIATLTYKTTFSTQQEKLGKRVNSLLGKVIVQCDQRKYRIASEEWYYGIQIAISRVNYPANNPFLDARPDTVASILIALACGERTFASIRELLAGKETVQQPASTASANLSPETPKQGAPTRLSISEIDPRFASIVVVSNARGFGTGFFVARDMIITNEHVVTGSDFTDIRFYDGRQSSGKVVKRDIDKDLALIRVADQGKPVTFSDVAVKIGNSVDVIGHPRGLGYSLSRGVVSAIRAMNNPGSPGGKPIKYIQTDAVINAGNSGGPMFVDNKVVGINTQKLTGGGIEGIGFAVHLDEIREFIRE